MMVTTRATLELARSDNDGGEKNNPNQDIAKKTDVDDDDDDPILLCASPMSPRFSGVSTCQA